MPLPQARLKVSEAPVRGPATRRWPRISASFLNELSTDPQQREDDQHPPDTRKPCEKTLRTTPPSPSSAARSGLLLPGRARGAACVAADRPATR